MSEATHDKVARRADGWPLCPQCGEDELWSPLHWYGYDERPSIEQYLEAGLTCYQCHWTNIDPITLKVTPLL